MNPNNDPAAQNRQVYPQQPAEQYQQVRMERRGGKYYIRSRSSGPGCFRGSCFLIVSLLVVAFLLLLAYFLAPLRTNFLVLGIDRTPDGTALGRSDTIILVSVIPLKPTVNMLSIPRDLWVNVPGVGENRINTAHFFAEANQEGSGPQAALDTVNQNFNLDVPYYVRVRFDGFMRVIDAMGGVTINLSEPTGILPAGEHHLNSEQALAFARDRSGADDFFRMEHGQILIRAVVSQMMSPSSWDRLPAVIQVGMESIETNIPIYHWPRLGVALLRGTISGMDNRTITRDMVTPFTTSGGAAVLAPNWDRINPVVDEMFR